MTERINTILRLRFDCQLDQDELADELGVAQAY